MDGFSAYFCKFVFLVILKYENVSFSLQFSQKQVALKFFNCKYNLEEFLLESVPHFQHVFAL